jgi:ribosomal protein S12 methylthiotransferase
MTPSRRAAIVTNDVECDKNIQYYSRMEKYFLANGWAVVTDFDADLFMFVSCGFHDCMEGKFARFLEAIRKRGIPMDRVVLGGCLPLSHAGSIRSGFSGLVVPSRSERLLDERISARVPFAEVPLPAQVRHAALAVRYPELPRRKDDRFFLNISEGCLMECTFCVHKLSRGGLRSRPLAEIVAAFRDAVAAGHREFLLVADDAFAWGHDKGFSEGSIIDLATALLDLEPDARLHFGPLHVRWLVRFREGLFRLCERGAVRALHVGLQHVDEELLRLMGRGMDFQEAYGLLRELRARFPGLFISADILVGFPGETEERFLRLLSFFREDKVFDAVSHFGFSAVRNAPASGFPGQVGGVQIAARWAALAEVLGARSYSGSDPALPPPAVGDLIRSGSDCYRQNYLLTLYEDFLFVKDCFL